MKFRSRKDRQQSIILLSKKYKKIGDGFTYFGDCFKEKKDKKKKDEEDKDEEDKDESIIKAREDLPEKLNYDARIVRTRLNEWYIKFPIKVEETDVLGSDNQAPFEKICSLDPGLRTFQTIYDINGAVIEVGVKDQGRIFRLCLAADKLISKRSTTVGKKRYRYQKAYLRIFRKIRRLVEEVHNKLAKFLVLNYNLIYLPSFNVQQMLNKSTRKINSKSARMMTAWSHYKFREKLKCKASLLSHCKLVICDESYTSKTCTNCGNLNNNLGSEKLFSCKKCGLKIDRDFNGARNILLKSLAAEAVKR